MRQTRTRVTAGSGLGKAIKKARIDRDIRQADLAEALNVTGGYLSQIERGRAPSYQLLERIAAELGISVSDLLLGETRDANEAEGDLVELLQRLQARVEELERTLAARASDGAAPIA